MQSFNFACGLGGLIAPIIVEPFLVETETLLVDEFFQNATELSNQTIEVNASDLLLVYPYSFDAVMLLMGALTMLATYILSPQTEEHPSRKEQQNNRSSSNLTTVSTCDSIDKSVSSCQIRSQSSSSSSSSSSEAKELEVYKAIVITLALLFSHIYYGLLLAFGSFLVSFAFECDLNLSKKEGTRLTSLFWGTFTFWRLTTLFYHEYLGNEKLIQMSLAIVLVGNVFLIPFGNSSVTCLWIGVGIIGLGISSVWSAMFGYLEEHFPVTSRIASGMIISALVGEFIFPLIISYFVQSNPEIFLWVTLFCSVSLVFIFALQMFVMRTKLKSLKQCHKSDEFSS